MRLAIYFDWDGTLADSMDLCLQEVAEALQAVGHERVTGAELRACNGPTPAESCGFFGLEGERAEAYLQARHDAQLRLIPTLQKLYPGIAQSVWRLKERAELYIVSNGLGDYVRASVRSTGLDGAFSRIEAGHPELTKGQLLGKMLADARSDRAILVGDREGDIRAALENGLPAIAVRYGYGTEAEFAGATRIVDTVAAMEQALMEWLSVE